MTICDILDVLVYLGVTQSACKLGTCRSWK